MGSGDHALGASELGGICALLGLSLWRRIAGTRFLSGGLRVAAEQSRGKSKQIFFCRKVLARLPRGLSRSSRRRTSSRPNAFALALAFLGAFSLLARLTPRRGLSRLDLSLAVNGGPILSFPFGQCAQAARLLPSRLSTRREGENFFLAQVFGRSKPRGESRRRPSGFPPKKSDSDDRRPAGFTFPMTSHTQKNVRVSPRSLSSSLFRPHRLAPPSARR